MITSRLTPTEGSVYIAKNYRVGVLEQNSLSDSALFADGGEETVLDRMYNAFGELRSIGSTACRASGKARHRVRRGA